MAHTNSLRRFGVGLVVSLAAAFSGLSARADAESESPFVFDPPAGWMREVKQDGRVNYRDPQNPNCGFIQIQPVIPKDLSLADDGWLRQFFDAEIHQQLSAYGIGPPYNTELPFFRKGSIGTYIYREFSVNVGDEVNHHQLLFLFMNGTLQEAFSVANVTHCPNGPSLTRSFFEKAATQLE